jgi:hypothetical protein
MFRKNMGRSRGMNDVRLRVKKRGYDRSRRLAFFTVFRVPVTVQIHLAIYEKAAQITGEGSRLVVIRFGYVEG